MTLTGSSGREYETRTVAEEIEHRERQRLIAIALGPQDDIEAVRDAMRKLDWGPLP
ncbi:MAG TPA: hypothetical protein VIQ30_23750 [Pseudonocardia sp.]